MRRNFFATLTRVLNLRPRPPRPADGAGDAAASESARQALRIFTASLVHELRTPLSALSAEVELALRRDRSPAMYRTALMRIAQQASELVDLTDSLALLGDPAGFRDLSAGTTDLEALTTQLSTRYEPSQVVMTIPPDHVHVVGHEALLARAFILVLDHALRNRDRGSTVRLRTSSPDLIDSDESVTLILDASAPGFSRRTWNDLTGDGGGLELTANPGSMRLRTASTIVGLSGGTLTADGADGAVRVRIQLRRAPTGAGAPRAETL